MKGTERSEEAIEFGDTHKVRFLAWLQTRRADAEAVRQEVGFEDEMAEMNADFADKPAQTAQPKQSQKIANELAFSDFLAKRRASQPAFTCAQLQHATGIRPTSAARLLQVATARGQLLRVVGANNRALYRIPGTLEV